MVMSFVFVLSLVMSLVLSVAVYPLALGGLILLMSFVVLGLISFEFSVFFGLVLLLIFVGGLLVAFGYAVALASNPVFGFMNQGVGGLKVGGFLYSLSFMIIVFLLFFWLDFEVDLGMSEAAAMFQSGSGLIVGRDWGVMVVILGGLLFINMVAVVSVCSYYKGALVEFNRS